MDEFQGLDREDAGMKPAKWALTIHTDALYAYSCGFGPTARPHGEEQHRVAINRSSLCEFVII